MLISSLRPLIRLYAPGCPDPVIDMALVDATRSLCRSTNVWRFELESSDLSKEGDNVVLSPPAGTHILTVFSVEYGDVGPLTPRTAAQLTRTFAGWRDVEGEPLSFVYTPPLTLRLYPQPTSLALSDLTVTVSLMPELGITEIDDRVATQHSEVIRLAALGQLLLMPNKPWSDARLGAGYLQAAGQATDGIVEDGTDTGLRNLPRRVRYGGY